MFKNFTKCSGFLRKSEFYENYHFQFFSQIHKIFRFYKNVQIFFLKTVRVFKKCSLFQKMYDNFKKNAHIFNKYAFVKKSSYFQQNILN